MSEGATDVEIGAAHKANEQLGGVKDRKPGFLGSFQKKVHRLSTVTGIDILDTYESAELANIDPLTGLMNRKALKGEWKRAQSLFERGELDYKFLFLDLDKFKPINDVDRSHKFGDDILMKVAETLTAMLRPEDSVARIGGDEFAVLMLGNSETVDEEIQEEFEKRFQEKFQEVVGEEMLARYPQLKELDVSVGIGNPKMAETFVSIYKRADDMMYQRKEEKGEVR